MFILRPHENTHIQKKTAHSNNKLIHILLDIKKKSIKITKNYFNAIETYVILLEITE